MRHLISKAGTIAGYVAGGFAIIGGIGLAKASTSTPRVVHKDPPERITVRSSQSQIPAMYEILVHCSQRDFMVIQILDDMSKGIFIAEYLNHANQHEFIWTGHTKSLTMYVDLDVDVRPLFLINGAIASTLEAIHVYSEIHSDHKILPEIQQ